MLPTLTIFGIVPSRPSSWKKATVEDLGPSKQRCAELQGLNSSGVLRSGPSLMFAAELWVSEFADFHAVPAVPSRARQVEWIYTCACTVVAW